jgi:hypothetical protein
MKRLVLILFYLLNITIIGNAQSASEQVNGLIGMNIKDANVKLSKNNKILLKTKYGTIPAKVKLKYDKISEIKITVENNDENYDKIAEDLVNITTYRVGRKWTDFTIKYIEVPTLYIKGKEEAFDFYEKYATIEIEAYKGLIMFKHPKKDKYLIGNFRTHTNKQGYITSLIDDEGRDWSDYVEDWDIIMTNKKK